MDLPTTVLMKPISSGQISLKMTRPTVVSMTFLSGVAVMGFAAPVGIGHADAVMEGHAAIAVGEDDLGLGAEEHWGVRGASLARGSAVM